MIYALDTNIISYLLCGDTGVTQRWRRERAQGKPHLCGAQKQGRPIEDADLLIAAQAVSRGYMLATNNVKHFKLIDRLKLVNWTE